VNLNPHSIVSKTRIRIYHSPVLHYGTYYLIKLYSWCLNAVLRIRMIFLPDPDQDPTVENVRIRIQIHNNINFGQVSFGNFFWRKYALKSSLVPVSMNQKVKQ
jgi:hypothetical protein